MKQQNLFKENNEKEVNFYTKQLCKGCNKLVIIDAMDFLLNLGEDILCKDCEKLNKEMEKQPYYKGK